MAVTEHRRGLLWGVLGVLVIVPDATLIRLVGASSLTTALWRSGLATVALAAFLGVRYRSHLPAVVRSLGRWGLVSSLLGAVGTILFVIAVDTTAVANVVLILALSPMWAAILTRLLTGEPTPRRTLIAMPLAVVGVAIAVTGSLETGVRSGDVIALAISLGLAVNLTIVRANSHIDMVPAAAVGNLLGFVALVVAGTSFTLAAEDLGPMLLLGLVVIPGAVGLLTTAARYLASPETALLLLGETALSPILAAVVIDEPITRWGYAGGGIVLATLAAHAWAGLRTEEFPVPAFETLPLPD